MHPGVLPLCDRLEWRLYVSAELRDQFNGLKAEIDARAMSAPSVAPLTQSISNPPTQAQVQALQTKLNELIAALKAAS